MGHGHHHGHSHAPAASGTGTQRALLWALALNGGFLFIEAGVGWVTGSLALLSDAVHMLGDVGALLVALGAGRLALQGWRPSRTYGLKRAEVLGGFVNGLTMLLAVAWIVWEAVDRLASGPPEVPGTAILVVGVIGLAINLGSAWWLWRADKDSLNVRGALVHMLADALGSVGAIVAAGLVMWGFPAADALVSLFIAALVLYGTWGVLRDTTAVLLELPPPGFDVDGLRAVLRGDAGVASIHDLHVWTLDGVEPLVTVHLVLEQGVDPTAVRDRVRGTLKEALSVTHTTLQLEAAGSGHCHGCEGAHEHA